MPTPLAALACLAVLSAAAAPAFAQHATAFDVEDGARTFASICANCHGPDGNLIAGIDLGRGQFRRALTDNELAGIIENGIPNTAMPPSPNLSEEQVERVVAFLRANAAAKPSATLTGDAARGKTLFEGKGECTDCHRVNGRGSRTGPDLSAVGKLRRAVELEQSLLDPAAEVQANNRFYRVVTADGKEVEGRLLNRDTYTVQLLDGDENLRSFRVEELREHGFDETPMPSVRKKLSSRDIADLVAYLISLQGPIQ
ncbi:MAG TPA: c-type cytochrome [Gammaproteobacteria bacterium]|nr:c-type cytochrome [Gammaproteobacteria bacterium]